jgi:hypothetical protein
MGYIFDGENKLITVSGVTGVLVSDLYSRWKDWVSESDNSKYYDAFRTFGGDPTIQGQFAPSYYFLVNDWKIFVPSGNSISFEVNLYSDGGDSPFIVDQGASVTNRNSDAVIVDQGVTETLNYDGVVTIDTTNGLPGTTYPKGTAAVPVNNLTDAITIANERNIRELHIYGEVIFDQDLNDFEVRGGNLSDRIIAQGVNLSGTTFRQLFLGGSFIGPVAGDNVILDDGVSNVSGFFQRTGFRGSISLAEGSESNFVDCFSLVPGSASPSLFLGNDMSVSIRRYSGGMAIYDCRTGTTMTIEYTGGNCRILSGNTGGYLEVRGITKLTDQSSGTQVVTNGVVGPLIWNTPISGTTAEGTAGYELYIARLQAALAAALSA